MRISNEYSQLLKSLAKKNSTIFWDITSSSLPNLSDEAVLERILNLGNYSQFKSVVKDTKSFNTIYSNIIEKRSGNLRPEIINYVEKYLKKYA